MESADEKHDHTLSDSSSTAAGHEVKRTDDAFGTPDVGHKEAEGVVPGHDLDVELAQQVSPSPPFATAVTTGKCCKPAHREAL